MLQTVVDVERGAEVIADNYKHSLVESREQYDAMYKRSIEDPEGFWSDIAKDFYWEKEVHIMRSVICHQGTHSVSLIAPSSSAANAFSSGL